MSASLRRPGFIGPTGWLGAVAAYLVPAIVGLTSPDLERVRSCYLVMGLMGW